MAVQEHYAKATKKHCKSAAGYYDIKEAID